jgi:hypothetical protein
MALPVTRKIHRRLATHSKTGNATDLFAIGNAAVIFPPSGFLRKTQQIRACDMMVMAGFTATEPSKI